MQLHLLLTTASKTLTLAPVLLLPHCLLIRGLSFLLGADRSKQHPVLGKLLRLANPLFNIYAYLPALPLVGALLLLIPRSAVVWNGPWVLLFPFMSAMACQVLCVLASDVVTIVYDDPDLPCIERELYFGEKKPDKYDPLATLILTPFTWVSAPVLFGLVYLFGKMIIH